MRLHNCALRASHHQRHNRHRAINNLPLTTTAITCESGGPGTIDVAEPSHLREKRRLVAFRSHANSTITVPGVSYLPSRCLARGPFLRCSPGSRRRAGNMSTSALPLGKCPVQHREPARFLHADAACRRRSAPDHLAGPVRCIGRRNLIRFTASSSAIWRVRASTWRATPMVASAFGGIGSSRPIRSSASRRRRLRL